MRNHLFILAAAMACACSERGALVEEYEATSGRLEPFEIGMSKSGALRAAISLGAEYARPVPCDEFAVTSLNRESLPGFDSLEGIRISKDSKGFSDVYFSHGIVARIVAPTGLSISTDVRVGSSATQVRAAVLRALQGDPGLIVSPILAASSDFVALRGHDGQLSPTLVANNCWIVQSHASRPSGELWRFRFKGDALVWIHKQRERVQIN